ncbi:MAG: hypothetical protein WCR79_06590 [Fusobacterium sp.]
MFNLIKYDFKSKSKIFLTLILLFVIENIYVIIKSGDSFNVNEILFVNMIFMFLIFVCFSFFLNLTSFKNHLSPQPGYMIFMGNISRKEYILTKILTFFLESFFIGTFIVTVFLLEMRNVNVDVNFYSSFFDVQNGDISVLVIQGFKIIFYLSVQYLTLITIFMLSIIIRNVLLKNTKFKGIITFIFANVLFFLRNYLYEILNLSFYRGVNFRNSMFSNISSYIILVDVLYLFIIVYTLIYLMERKLDI